MNRVDNFNRTDSNTTLGTPSDGGSDWVVQSGTWGISGNKAYQPASNLQATAVLEAGVADCDVQVTLSNADAFTDDGFVFRSTDDNNYWVFTYPNGGLYKRVAGGFSLVAFSAAPPFNGAANPTILKAVLRGASIKIYQDGTLVFTTSDSFNQTATKHGLRSNASNTCRFDEFSIAAASPDQHHSLMHLLLLDML